MKARYWMALTIGALAGAAQADVTLGPYNFNSQQFGNTLTESDGGTFSAGNWLNVVNADPGNPAYLTGANFNTGIANIGLSATPVYRIGYNTAIVNGPGPDVGIVTARFSTGDTINLDVSSNGGATFQGAQSYLPAAAVASGVACNYFYGGSLGNTFGCDLFVTPVDLSDFGIALGGSINMVSVTGAPELDLVRIAGFGDPNSTVPVPGTAALIGLGLLGLASSRRRKA